jgi:hypothetical protein
MLCKGLLNLTKTNGEERICVVGEASNHQTKGDIRMKKITVSLLVFVLMAVMVTPVLAASGSAGSPRGTFSLVGTIASVDAAAGTVTVNVLRGNTLVKSYFGKTLTVSTSTATRYLYKSAPTAVPVAITFADLKVGDAVSVNGTLANTVWTASRITVGASLSCLQ